MKPDDLRALIKRIGGPSVVAEALTTKARPLTQPAISNWIGRGRVPAEHCVALAVLAGIEPNALRPDVFGAPSKPNRAAA